MKKFSKIALGSFVFLMIFSIFSITSVLAVGETEVPINNEFIYQHRIEANNRTMFKFAQQTRLTFTSNVDLVVNIECDASEIGVKFFEIEVNGSGPLLMNMTCTEEQVQLGLQKGFNYRIRERHRYLYEEGFCVQIKCNGTCEAKLKIQATNRNRLGTWAYYDETEAEWVASPTTIEDGYLITATTHFSYWTILIPETDFTVFIVIGVVATIGVIALISVLYIRKRK
jgi:hypothetical protein